VQVVLDPEGQVQDPDAAVSLVVPADPATALAEVNEQVVRAPEDAWVEAWRSADDAAARVLGETLGDELSEPWVARELGRLLSHDATLVAASSMPVRDVETFFPALGDPPRVLANRGANGIDGTVSTAFGVAATAPGPVVLLVGDVALAHDAGGLLAASRLGLKLTIVLLNNDGGGIFHFLPIAGEQDVFERHVATPTGLDFARLAAAYECEHRLVEGAEDFGRALDAAVGSARTAILEVRTDREANLALHRRCWDAVQAAL
jgi:2-succinyl-5-enolpyruvyl-6-hydroxy-3-cyclohexene-1-carboxylate synthase